MYAAESSKRIESPWCAGIFLSSADFIKKYYDDLESNSLIPDHVTCFVGLDLGPNCFKRLSVDDQNGSQVESKNLEFFSLSLEPVKKVPKPTPTNRSNSSPHPVKWQNKRLILGSRKPCN